MTYLEFCAREYLAALTHRDLRKIRFWGFLMRLESLPREITPKGEIVQPGQDNSEIREVLN